MMIERDKQIISDLERFRVLGRDHIIQLHFAHLKNPVTNANTVLKRLVRDRKIDVNTDYRKYLYFPIPSIYKRSSKLPHYLSICDFYLECKKHKTPLRFTIEPKYGKAYMEPDIFMIWMGTPFFVEIQRHQYTDKVMKEKMARYEAYYYSDEWKSLDWQPADKKVFPRVWMITDNQYFLNVPFKLFQTKDVQGIVNLIKQ